MSYKKCHYAGIRDVTMQVKPGKFWTDYISQLKS